MQLGIGISLSDSDQSGAAVLPAPIINLEGDESSQFTYSTPPNIADWSGFAQATLTEQPSHNGTMNGLTVPSFDGVDEFLERAQLPITDMSFLFALQKNTNALTKTIMAQINTGGPTDIWFISVSGTGQIIMSTGTGTHTSADGAISDNTPTILSIVCEIGQTVRVYVDGVLSVLNSRTWGPAAGANKLVLGGRRSASPLATWIGLIARAQVWNSALSDSDRQAYETLATTKWIP